jgi:hypothetical protein
MLDELLRAATCFDWISPTLSIAQNVANGPSHTFLIPIHCGWTGREISNLLRNQGIKTWGHMIVHGSFMLTVPEKDAQFALTLMERSGLPVGGRPVSQARPASLPLRSRNSRGAGRKRARQSSGGILDNLSDLLFG